MILTRRLKVPVVTVLLIGIGLLYLRSTGSVLKSSTQEETNDRRPFLLDQYINDISRSRKSIRRGKTSKEHLHRKVSLIHPNPTDGGNAQDEPPQASYHVIRLASEPSYLKINSTAKSSLNTISSELDPHNTLQISPSISQTDMKSVTQRQNSLLIYTNEKANNDQKLNLQALKKISVFQRNDHNRKEYLLNEPNRTCQQHNHLSFIKVHKAGSSTMSNVFFRFGVKNNLTFVLPSNDVIITFMQESSWSNILPPPPGKRYEIMCSHAVYVKSKIRELLPADTFYTAIIREPFSHLRSVIHYFYEKRISGKSKVKKYLSHPYQFKNLLFNNKRSFTNNSMSYELGLAPGNFYNIAKVTKFLHTIDREFGLILIMEDIEESLILLKRYLCWNLSDILFIRTNINIFKPVTEKVPPKLLITHQEINMADYMLYDYFSKRHKERVKDEGEDFFHEVTFYKSVLGELTKLCYALHTPRRMSITIQRSIWNKRFNISFEDCKLYMFNGNEILNFVKRYQYPDVKT